MNRMNTLTKFLLTGVLAASFTVIVPAALAERDDVRGKKGKGNVKREKSHHADALAEDKREEARPDARRGGPPSKGGPGVRRGGPPQKGGPGVRRGGPPQKGGPGVRRGGPPQKGGPGMRRGGPPSKGGLTRYHRGDYKHERGHRR